MTLVVRALRSMELLAPLTIPQLQRLAEALKIERHVDGEFICRQGGVWDAFHIVAKVRGWVGWGGVGFAEPLRRLHVF